MSNANSAVQISELYEKWGLDSHAFLAVEARLEKRLNDVLILPDWYYELLGDIHDSTLKVVVGVRGSGKSAIRRLISDRCSSKIFSEQQLKGLVLSVEIDHDVIEWVREPDDLNMSLRHFAQHIIELVSIGIAANVSRDELKAKLARSEREQLDRHLVNSFNSSTPERLDELRKKTKTTYKTVTESDPFKKTIDIVSARLGAANSSDTALKMDMSLVTSDLPSIIMIAKKVGFDAIYVLVDEIDEYPETQTDYIRAAKLVVSLLSSNWLLELESLALKVFLSEAIFNTLPEVCELESKEIRWDRISKKEPFRLSWDTDDIKNMLKQRLKTYSIKKEDPVSSMSEFSVPGLAERIDDEIAKYAYRSPRYYISFCQDLARAAARKALINNFKITEEIFEEQLLKFSKLACKEQYSGRAINSLVKLKKTEFTKEEFIEDLNIEPKQAESALRALTIPGGVEKYEDLSGASYTVKDPRIIYLIDFENSYPGEGLILG